MRRIPARSIMVFALSAAALLVGAARLVPAQSSGDSLNGPDTSKAKSTEPKAKVHPKQAVRPRSKERARRDPPGFYMGRRIAEVMSWQGVDWLFRETRIEEEQPEAMLDALEIPRGAVVADVGAGAGYHSVRLARRVGPTGTVFATDIQPEMIQMLRQHARASGFPNIQPILSTPRDPRLPEGKVDLILMVDVYHECSHPEETLRGLWRALRPGGRLVLVEFRGEDENVPIKPEHKMTLAQVRREVEPQGFEFVDCLGFLPWQHIILFRKPDAARGGDQAPGPAEAGSRPMPGSAEAAGGGRR